MARTRLSSKGQVVLPKDLRDCLGWAAGTELEVAAEGQVVLLRPASGRGQVALDELIGCIPYDGPPVSVAEMDEAVEEAARRMWHAFERQGDQS